MALTSLVKRTVLPPRSKVVKMSKLHNLEPPHPLGFSANSLSRSSGLQFPRSGPIRSPAPQTSVRDRTRTVTSGDARLRLNFYHKTSAWLCSLWGVLGFGLCGPDVRTGVTLRPWCWSRAPDGQAEGQAT